MKPLNSNESEFITGPFNRLAVSDDLFERISARIDQEEKARAKPRDFTILGVCILILFTLNVMAFKIKKKKEMSTPNLSAYALWVGESTTEP